MTVVKFNNRRGNGFQLFEDLLNDLPSFFKDDNNDYQKSLIPVNIKETNGNFLVEVIAPGFEKNDFNINLEKDILTISAERKDDKKNGTIAERDLGQIRKEYSYRPFKRSFSLNEKVDTEKIEAKYVNGVLTLNLPIKQEVKASPKEISVQ